MGNINMGDNSWAEKDAWSLIKPDGPCVAAGVYDFSGTAPAHAYCETDGLSITKDEIDAMSQFWMDKAKMDSWTSDDHCQELIKKGTKIGVASKAGYDKCMIRMRRAFGDGDCQHIVTAMKGKKGIIVAHSDFTAVVGLFDTEDNSPPGPCELAIEGVAASYKETGY